MTDLGLNLEEGCRVVWGCVKGPLSFPQTTSLTFLAGVRGQVGIFPLNNEPCYWTKFTKSED